MVTTIAESQLNVTSDRENGVSGHVGRPGLL